MQEARSGNVGFGAWLSGRCAMKPVRSWDFAQGSPKYRAGGGHRARRVQALSSLDYLGKKVRTAGPGQTRDLAPISQQRGTPGI